MTRMLTCSSGHSTAPARAVTRFVYGPAIHTSDVMVMNSWIFLDGLLFALKENFVLHK